MTEKVLIVTGGLITGKERSVLDVARKWRAQRAAASVGWLDVKVKTVLAEPLLASRIETVLTRLRTPNTWRTTASSRADRTNVEVPCLTEVVLATLLERAGMPHERLDLDALFTSPASTERLLDDATCVFLSSTYLHDFSELEPVLRRLKRPHNRIVIGGAFAGIAHDRWPAVSGVDVVAVGYGERLVEPLVAWMRSGYQKLEPVTGGRIERRGATTFLYSGLPADNNLDTLETPDWGLAMDYHGTRFPMIYYESVRGCPYRCSFCNYPFLFDDTRFRFKSAAKIADDWERYASELGVEYITCLDSLFTVPKQRLHELCRMLIERRTPVKWICYARADDLADERTVAMMREAGAHQVQIGIESGDDTLLDNMNKVCSVASNAAALHNCRKHGLTTVISLIVGFPGETPNTLETTYRFLSENPPDFYFLATFSTRVAGVPLLEPENRRRFGLNVNDTLYSMAPYWEHDTMSCTDVGNHVRDLDRRLMLNRVALNATLFYPQMLSYAPAQRDGLLDFQQRAAGHRTLLRLGFDLANRWIDRRLRRAVRAHFAERDHVLGPAS